MVVTEASVQDAQDFQLTTETEASSAGPALGGLAQLRRLSTRRALVADVIGLVAASALGLLLLSAASGNEASTPGHLLPTFLVDLAFIPMFLAIFATYGLYRRNARRVATSLFTDLKDIAHALAVSGFLFAAVSYVGERGLHLQTPGTAKIVALCVAGALTVPLSRAGLAGLNGRAVTGTARVIVVGTGVVARTTSSHLRSRPGVEVVGYVDDNPVTGHEVLGGLEDLPELCRRHQVSRVVVCFSQTHPERTVMLLRGLEGQVAVSIVPRFYELVTCRSHVEDLCGLPMIDIAPASFGTGARFAKRAFDVVVSAVLLAVASPVLLGCAIAIKITSQGPVFFRQERTGRYGKTFLMLKFRTMFVGAEARRSDLVDRNEVDGPLFKVKDDPRITRAGRFLRRTSLDELPQLMNVFRGDMSLVGPRPLVVDEAAKISGWARRRFDTRPGITGLWQISGRNELSYMELCRLDYLYVA
ncbi:MAG: sugar transferase, partial [Acidimicrobiales bacterium]